MTKEDYLRTVLADTLPVGYIWENPNFIKQMRNFLTRPLVFFDLETTDTDCAKAKIIELSFNKIHPTDPAQDERFYSLINPCESISEQITAITGITNDRVKDEPVFKSLAQPLADFLKDCDIAGYNIINFDIPIVVEEFLRAGIQPPFDKDTCYVDALKLFRKMFPHTLKGAYQFFVNKDWDDKLAHGASYDVAKTIEVLEAQLDIYNEEIPDKSASGLYKFTLEESNLVDYARKLCLNEKGEIVFNFGQHKDKPVKLFRSYAEWMLNQDFTLHTKLKLREALAMTPSHK